MGKTAAGCNIADHASVDLKKVTAFFSLEMPKKAILNRLLAARSATSIGDVLNGRLSATARRYMEEALSEIMESPLYIDDKPGQTIQQMQAKASILQSRAGLDMIIIDQLNHIAMPSGARRYGNRNEDVGEITRGLKSMAKALDVPVIVLHQLSRDSEKRTDHEPKLSDLRESGNIEQDADLVFFPFRPGYYDPKDETLRDKAVWILAKQRQGPTGRALCEYVAEQMKFRDAQSAQPGIFW